MQQSTISQFFRPKSKGSTTSNNSTTTSLLLPNASQTQKRTREEISLIDDDIPASQLPTNVKDRFMEILGRDSNSQQKRRKFQKILFDNSGFLNPSEGWADEDELMENNSDEEIADDSRYPDKLRLTKKVNYTPLETQVLNIRRQYPDCLMMVECGYRMRFFGDDALKAAAILGIYAHKDHNFMVASVPTYRAAYHCQRLLSRGQKVAIIRQTETAALRKGNTVSRAFDRKVAGVFTQGTLIDEDDPAFEGLVSWFNKRNSSKEKQSTADDSGDENEDEGVEDEDIDPGSIVSSAEATDDDVWIAAVYEEEQENIISIIGVNIRAHKLWICNLSVDSIRQSLIDYLDILKPVELIYCDTLPSITKERIYQRAAASAGTDHGKTGGDDRDHYIQLLRVFPVKIFTLHRENYLGTQEGTDWYKEISLVSQRAVNGLYHYLTEFHLTNIFLSPTIMMTSNVTDEVKGREEMTIAGSHEFISRESFPLDGITIRDLEIFDTLSTTNAKLRRVWKELWSVKTSSTGIASSGSLQRWKSLQQGLFGMIDHCRTVYGRRTLKQWLMNPLVVREKIMERQEVIEWFLNTTKSYSGNSQLLSNPSLLATKQKQVILEILQSCLEIEKLLTSLQYHRISFPKLVQLLQFAIKLQELSSPVFLTNAPNSSTGSQPFPVLLIQWLSSVDWNTIVTMAKCYLGKLKLSNSSSSNDNNNIISSGNNEALVDLSQSTSWKETITSFFTFETESHYPPLQAFQQQKQHYEQLLSEELQTLRHLLHKPHLQYTTFRSGTNSQIEHLIEVPITDLQRISIPNQWIKVNATKQVHRYHVPTVLSIQDALYKLRDESKIYAQKIWREFLIEITQALYPSLRHAIEILGQLDAILSLTIVASFPNYCKPIFPPQATNIEIEEGRHPLLEKSIEFLNTLSSSSSSSSVISTSSSPMRPVTSSLRGAIPTMVSDMIIPNDVHLSHSFQPRHCQIITGPNMGGKSSYVRMVGLLVLLAQIGSFIPAKTAKLCIFENMFTRMGSEDDLSSGRSTFLCELIRMKKILSSIQSKSLVIIDELGRGTSTHDGLAIAQATLQYLWQRIGCCTLFITHFPQIATLVESLCNDSPNHSCFNSHMSYLERQKLIPLSNSATTEGSEEETTAKEQEIIFLYKMVDEPSQGSYGVNVARLAGISKQVLRKAIIASSWMSQQQQ